MTRRCAFAWDGHSCARPPGHPTSCTCYCAARPGEPAPPWTSTGTRCPTYQQAIDRGAAS